MRFLDQEGLSYLWSRIRTALSGKQDKLTGTQGQIVGFDAGGAAALQTVPVGSGGTGGATAADGMYNLISGLAAQSGSHSSANVRLPFADPSHTNKVGYIPLSTVQALTINRDSAVNQANTAYTTFMARGISLTTSAPSSLTNGCIAFVYV